MLTRVVQSVRTVWNKKVCELSDTAHWSVVLLERPQGLDGDTLVSGQAGPWEKNRIQSILVIYNAYKITVLLNNAIKLSDLSTLAVAELVRSDLGNTFLYFVLNFFCNISQYGSLQTANILL
jgi:hypothetical protein